MTHDMPAEAPRNALLRWIARRVAFAVLLVFVLASAAMVLARLAPGDSTSELLGSGVGQAAIDAARARQRLDLPVAEHYGAWVIDALRLDLGVSARYGRPVRELVAERAANTAMLATTALALASLIGLPLGVVAGSRPGTWLAHAIGGVSTVAISVPPLLLSLLLAFLAARTGWFPVGGMGGAMHLVLPSLALGLPLAATLERLQSQSMEEVLGEPYLRGAASRGVPRARLVWRHAWRVALRPVLAVYGLVVGSLLSGSFGVEIVMAWPGLGRLTYDALMARDVHLVAGCAAAGAVVLTAAILVFDVLSRVSDPRLREAEA